MPEESISAVGEGMTQEAAFALLRDVVQDFETSGKRPFAAGIKPEMQIRSQNTFSESHLGYVTFRDFLEAAAKSGIVEVQSEGPHLRAHVPGVVPALDRQQAQTRRESSWIHIPSHLWTAFVDWSPEKRRFYDRSLERAIVFSANATPGEPADESARRELVNANPERFVEIHALDFDTQVGWMKAYANTLPDADRRLAGPVLENDPRPANAFNLFLRRNPHLLNGWKMFKLERVRDAMRAWMDEHHIDNSIIDETKNRVGPVEQARTETTSSPARSDLERVRSRVRAAIDRMPLTELLRLSIPVEYMIESE
jgi:hypothetical protein